MLPTAKMEPEQIMDLAADSKLIPTKSSERYWNAYNAFTKWQQTRDTEADADDCLAEETLQIYFNELSKKVAPSTLWSQYSMLKTMLNSNHNLNIANYPKLVSFLKKNAQGFRSKKGHVFHVEEIQRFVCDAPNEIYLASKVKLYTQMIDCIHRH